MWTNLRILPDTLLRAIGLLAVSWGFVLVYEATVPEPVGADIGEGLLSFALLIGASAGWAAWDASRRSVLPVAVTWVAAGLLTSVGMAPLVVEARSLTEVLAHLGGVDPFWAGLVAVPALLSAGLVVAVRLALRPAVGPPSA
jgi:hypothetical protein